jgi:hypothetical protein
LERKRRRKKNPKKNHERQRSDCNSMIPGEPSLDSRVEDKISWAEYIYKQWKDQVLSDSKVAQLLAGLKRAALRSHEKMVQAGIVDLCKECEEEEGGSCCGAGLENHYTSILLFVNLLLGANVPHHRSDQASCFFLSKNGCQLLARHVICVNYLCAKIATRVPASEISSLRELEGVELDLLFVLHERLKRILGRLIKNDQMQGDNLSYE